MDNVGIYFKESLKSTLKMLRLWNVAIWVWDSYTYQREYWIIRRQIRKISSSTKTVLFFPFYHTGGAELVHLQISNCLRGKAVVFFSLTSSNNHFKKEFEASNTCIDIKRHIRTERGRLKLLKLIARQLNKTEPKSVLGCHSQFYYELLPLLNKKIKKTDIIHAFTHPNERGFEKSTIPILHLIDERITISYQEKQNLLGLYKEKKVDNIFGGRITIIPNPVRFSSNTYSEKPKDLFNVLYVGRNSPEKRIDLIAHIAALLEQKVSIHFDFAGDQLEQNFKVGTNKNCTFHGSVEDPLILEKLYNKSHVVLITSSREGMPLSLAEGMTFGCVPLSTDVGAIHEYVKNGENGFLIPAQMNDKEIVEQFVENILELSENRSNFETMSHECYARAKEYFNLNSFCRAYRNVLLNDE